MPICSTCNRQLYRSDKGRRLDSRLATITSDKKRRPYRKHLKESCVNCGFVPQHTCQLDVDHIDRSEEHTSELQSLMRISYAVFCLKKKTKKKIIKIKKNKKQKKLIENT